MGMRLQNVNNGGDGTYESWHAFATYIPGAQIAPGDVFTIVHGNADNALVAEANDTMTLYTNGNDGHCLMKGTEAHSTVVDLCGGFWGCSRNRVESLWSVRCHQGSHNRAQSRQVRQFELGRVPW